MILPFPELIDRPLSDVDLIEIEKTLGTLAEEMREWAMRLWERAEGETGGLFDENRIRIERKAKLCEQAAVALDMIPRLIVELRKKGAA